MYNFFLSKALVSVVLLNPNVFWRVFKKNAILMYTSTSNYIFFKTINDYYKMIKSPALKIQRSYYILVFY